MELTDAQKKERAERMRAARAAKKAADASRKETKETKANEHAETAAPEAPAAEAGSTGTVIQVTPKDPMVTIHISDSAIPNNQYPIGKGRMMTGSGRTFKVTLSDFEGDFMTPFTMKMLEKRIFIVMDGLTDEQRAQYNCLYKENEVIKDEGVFDFFFSAPVEDAAKLYAQLCPQHREMVSRRFMQAFENGDNRLSKDRVEALNQISKQDSNTGTGLFTPILRKYNEEI